MTKCPYCGRRLREHERYCDFCEQDLTEAIGEKLKMKKEQITGPIKEAIQKFKEIKQPKISAYCVKCNKKVIVNNPKNYTMKNKRQAVKGACPYCSTKVFRILGMKRKK